MPVNCVSNNTRQKTTEDSFTPNFWVPPEHLDWMNEFLGSLFKTERKLDATLGNNELQLIPTTKVRLEASQKILESKFQRIRNEIILQNTEFQMTIEDLDLWEEGA